MELNEEILTDEHHPIVCAILSISNLDDVPFRMMVHASRRKWDDFISMLGAYAFCMGFIIRNLQ